MKIPKIGATFFCEDTEVERGTRIMSLLKGLVDLSNNEELIRSVETLVRVYKNKTPVPTDVN